MLRILEKLAQFLESITVPSSFLDAYYFIVGRRDCMSAGVSEFLWRMLWFIASTVLLTYICYLYFGSVGATQQRSTAHVEVTDTISRPGEHHLHGMLTVPSECHGLSVRTDVVSGTQYRLALTMWQEPTRTCEPHDQIRAFETVVFAPSTGVSFVATLDGQEIPITITTRH